MKITALILIYLFTISTYAQNQFTGFWFVLRSESHQSEYSNPIIDSTSLDDLKGASSYSSTSLYYFLDIKKNGRLKIIAEKKHQGKWKMNNDTIVLQLKETQLYGNIKDNYLELKPVKNTSAHNEFIVATRLPKSNINNYLSFKGKSILYEPTSYSSYNFHFLNNRNVILIQNENQAKWSDIGTWNLIKHKDYKFLSIRKSSHERFLFLLLNENDVEMDIYDFSKEYVWGKDFNENKIIKLKIDKEYSQEINQKLIGKWTLSDYKPLYKLYENFELKSFNLEIEKSNVKIHIETSEDLIYNLNYKYEMGRIPNYFILKGDKGMEPMSFVFDETSSKLILCYAIDSKRRKYEYDLKIELKKL